MHVGRVDLSVILAPALQAVGCTAVRGGAGVGRHIQHRQHVPQQCRSAVLQAQAQHTQMRLARIVTDPRAMRV